MTDQHPALVPGVSVSRETLEKLRAFEALIKKWSPTINLVAPGTLGDVWHRHIEDSAQLLPLVSLPVTHWADLGSGAGLPGLVIAILLEGLGHTTKITLVESDQRKAQFLRTCIREISLTATVLPTRIEEAQPLNADVISARALAPLPRLLALIQPHLAPDGTALLPKGKSAQSEIDEARKSWHFHLDPIPSHTAPTSSILRLKGISRV